MQFTKQQLKAIDHSGGNLQLIACARSGKTEVVARRVAALLNPKRGKLSPRNIIAFTGRSAHVRTRSPSTLSGARSSSASQRPRE